jgi:N-methylhydantoinase A
VQLVESGPAAGVAGAAHFASLAGYDDAITFDMGGTTAKAGLVLGGRPSVVSEFEVGAGSWSGSGLVKGSGYPLVGSVMDLVEVGAGGGSIAWIDAGGVLRVGPVSAGADPGPACYGRGGTAPTISDANLLLGRLDAEYFLGGRLPLALEAAKRAVEAVAAPLGLSTVEAAAGIVAIADATMMQALKLVSVQRGHDPRSLALVAFGGAGPLHAVGLAQELGVEAVVVPPSPGLASALGMLLTDMRQDLRTTHLRRLRDLAPGELEEVCERVVAAAPPFGEVDEIDRYVELRYVGQSWALRVPLDGGDLRGAFDSAHEAAYGYSVRGDEVEVVNVGVSLVRHVPKPDLADAFASREDPAWGDRRRRVWLGEWLDCRIVHRYALGEGDVVPGAAVIEEPDSALVVHPGWQAEVGGQRLLVLTRT